MDVLTGASVACLSVAVACLLIFLLAAVSADWLERQAARQREAEIETAIAARARLLQAAAALQAGALEARKALIREAFQVSRVSPAGSSTPSVDDSTTS